MQLRGNTRTTPDRPLDITDRDYLEDAIIGIQAIVAEQFATMGLLEVEISNENVESITEMLPPFHAFLLGRLTTLMDLHKELYGDNRLLPWIKKPESN